MGVGVVYIDLKDHVLCCAGSTLLAVDLSGSGMSGGEFISLGYHEKDDVDCVIEVGLELFCLMIMSLST